MTTEENFCIAISVCAFIPFIFGILGVSISHSTAALVVMLVSLAAIIGGIIGFLIYHNKNKKAATSQTNTLQKEQSESEDGKQN